MNLSDPENFPFPLLFRWQLCGARKGGRISGVIRPPPKLSNGVDNASKQTDKKFFFTVQCPPQCLLVTQVSPCHPCPSHQPPPCPVFPTLSTSMSSLPTTMFSLPTTIFSLSTSLSVPCPVFPPRARLRTHYRPGLCPKNHIKTGGL